MIDDLAWRKFPRGLITNAEINYITSCMPPELEALPLLFMLTAYCQADDNGYFNVKDGRIFANLCHMGDEMDVLSCASLLEEYELIARVDPEYNAFIIVDWEPPARQGRPQPRTMEDRRNICAEKIRDEKKKKQQAIERAQNFFTRKMTENANMSTNPLYDDKKRENVDTEREKERERDRQTGETEERQTEREEFREYREIKKDTHTEGRAPGLYRPSALPDRSVEEEPGKRTQENLRTQEAEIKNSIPTVQQLAQEAADYSESANIDKVDSTERAAVYMTLKNFFTKNYLGFDESASSWAMNDLADRIASLADKKTPARVTAAIICGEFYKLTEREGYYYGMAVTPENLLKNGAWPTVITNAGKILAKGANESWRREAMTPEEVAMERAATDNETREAALKYGLSLDDPNLHIKIGIARAKEQGKDVTNGTG